MKIIELTTDEKVIVIQDEEPAGCPFCNGKIFTQNIGSPPSCIVCGAQIMKALKIDNNYYLKIKSFESYEC